jgi:hypothetical protein
MMGLPRLSISESNYIRLSYDNIYKVIRYHSISVTVNFYLLFYALCPNVAKAGGLQSQGVKGEIVVGYLDPLTTQDLKSSGFPEG